MKKQIPWQSIIAHLKDEATPEEESLFRGWLEEDGNMDLFSEIELLWNEIRAESSLHNPDVDYYWGIMEERIKTKPTKKVSVWKKISTVAAACILLTLGISYLFFHSANKDSLHTYSAINGKSKLLLPDSSIVWINSGSTISYMDGFVDNRYLDLEGEASFEVKKDKKHPFIVSTSGIKVRVYGTHFAVNSFQDEDNIVVTLREGQVSVILNDDESFLKPGEMAVVNKKDLSVDIKKADTNLEFFWANESVYFKSKSLGYICKYLEKWYNVKIEVDPRLAESQLYTFTIKDDSLDAILRIMSKINPIAYSFDDKNNVKIMKVEP